MDRVQAVREAVAELGEVSNERIAEAVEAQTGIKLKPGLVAVIRASFRWEELVARKQAEARQMAADEADPAA